MPRGQHRWTIAPHRHEVGTLQRGRPVHQRPAPGSPVAAPWTRQEVLTSPCCTAAAGAQGEAPARDGHVAQDVQRVGGQKLCTGGALRGAHLHRLIFGGGNAVSKPPSVWACCSFHTHPASSCLSVLLSASGRPKAGAGQNRKLGIPVRVWYANLSCLTVLGLQGLQARCIQSAYCRPTAQCVIAASIVYRSLGRHTQDCTTPLPERSDSTDVLNTMEYILSMCK